MKSSLAAAAKVALFVVVCGATPAQDSSDSGTPALDDLDPVALCEGRKVAGLPERSQFRGGFRYRFESAASEAKFLEAPERYEIQLGGVCARMGPLSGRASPKRYAVYEGRIYLFASDACREGFLKDPARCLPKADAPADGDDAARAAGTALVDRMAEALGSACLDEFTTVLFKREKETKVDDDVRKDGVRKLFAPPASIRRDSWWGDATFAYVVGPKGAFEARRGEVVWALSKEAIDELRREATRVPALVARARKQDGFRAFKVGEGRVGDVDVDKVAVSFDGATTTWGIDRKLGLPLSAEFRGQGPDLRYGAVELRFSDFKKRKGVLFPFKVEGSYEGAPRPEMTIVWDEIIPDPTLKADVFVAP
jgi:hypothetical protein